MQFTKFTHACVRLDDGERRLLIDPGIWVEREAYDGVDEILLTHEHVDHVDVDTLVAVASANSSLVVRAPAEVVAQLGALGDAAVAVAPGEEFSAGGFAVHAVGGLHAEIYDGLPGCANLGYVVEGGVYHPGDAFHVPSTPVHLLCLPVSGPWLKLAESIDFVRAVAPVRAVPIHEALLSDLGHGLVDRWLGMKGGTDCSRVRPGESIEV